MVSTCKCRLEEAKQEKQKIADDRHSLELRLQREVDKMKVSDTSVIELSSQFCLVKFGFWSSITVQSIAWKDSFPEWTIMCRLGRLGVKARISKAKAKDLASKANYLASKTKATDLLPKAKGKDWDFKAKAADLTVKVKA